MWINALLILAIAATVGAPELFVKVPLNPGVYVDDTPLKAEGFFTSADKIRFVRGLPQVMGGYEVITTTPLTGICRGLGTWMDADLNKWIGAGTHTNLYGVLGAVNYDITPVTEYGTLSAPFSTVISTTAVTVADTAHGRAVGDGVDFDNASAVGGITVDGAYTVTTVTNANAYTITAASAATSTAGPGGGLVWYKYFVPIGYANAGGGGYSGGGYSTGGYSNLGASAAALRTWSIANLGQIGIFSPRDGRIYEWVPATTATELLTNGDFSLGSVAGWTLGTGYTFTGTTVQATLSNAALSSITTATEPNSWSLATMNITAISAGTVTLTVGATTVVATTTPGKYSGEYYSGSTGAAVTFALNASTSATFTVAAASLTQAATAVVMTNAPTQNTVVIVTPEGFVMTGGTINATTSVFDPLHIRWSDIGSVVNSQHTWTPSSTNLSGFVTLRAGSRIVGMKIANNEILAWTDKALYAGTYVNNSAIVYSFRLVGTNCGLMGPNACCVLGGTAYWYDPSGLTWTYSGGSPVPVKSTMSKDMFDHITLSQGDKIYSSPIAQFLDVMTLYPDSRDGAENSRFALLCTTEAIRPPVGTDPGTVVGCFAPGTYDLSAMMDSSAGLSYPVGSLVTGTAAAPTSTLIFMEKGATANGGTWDWSLQTGSIQIGTGETLWQVNSFIPDFSGLVGGGSMTAYGYLYPQSTPTTTGPFNFTSASEHIDLLTGPPIGREVSFLFEGSSSPAFMRTGVLMFDADDTGMTD